MTETPSAPGAARTLGRLELAGLTAGLMAMGALSIDIMIPALSAMSATYALTDPNDRQLIVIVYLFGLALGQLFYGPLTDRFGRRPMLLAAIAIYVAAAMACSFAPTFGALLAARFVQGIGGAGGRVVAMAIVRDIHSGRAMAQVMSLAGAIFLAAPIFAPSLGQLLLFVTPWPGIFVFLGLFGTALAVWIVLRTPETLPLDQRRPLKPTAVASAYIATMRPAVSLGYTLALALVLGGLLGFVSSAEQLFVVGFGMGRAFTLVFAVIAAGAAVSTLMNAAMVERWGMRMLSHVALIGFVIAAGLHSVFVAAGWESIVLFTVMMTAAWFSLGFMAGNFQALAMEPLGAIAGMGAAAIGFVSMIIGATIGGVIGGMFDGTPAPLVHGTTVVGLAALVVVAITERGRLFRPGVHGSEA